MLLTNCIPLAFLGVVTALPAEDSHQITQLQVSNIESAANGNNGSRGQLTVFGYGHLLLDATTDKVFKADEIDSCSSKSGKVTLLCGNSCDTEVIRKAKAILVPCPGGKKLIRPKLNGSFHFSPGWGDTFEYDVAFNAASNDNGAEIGMTIAYSPSDAFWEDEVLSMKNVPDVSTANTVMLGSFRDRFKAWVDKIRKVDIDGSKTIKLEKKVEDYQIDLSTTKNTCENKQAKINYGTAGRGLITLNADVMTKMTFGIKIVGTLIPFKIQDTLFYVKSGETEFNVAMDLNFGATFKVEKIFELFSLPLTPFQVPGIIAIGPSFGARLTNHMDISLDMKGSISLSHTVPSHDGFVKSDATNIDLKNIYSDADNERIAEAHVSNPKVDLGKGIRISGDWTLAVSPTIDFGINILDGKLEFALGLQNDNIIGMKANGTLWGSPDNKGYCVAFYRQLGGSLYRDLGNDKSQSLVAVMSRGNVFDTEGSCDKQDVSVPGSFTIDDKQRREGRKTTTCISVDRAGKLIKPLESDISEE